MEDEPDTGADRVRRTTTARVRVTTIASGSRTDGADVVVVEEPLQIHVEQGARRHLLGSTMRTPGHDLELAAGLAVGEGIVRDVGQIVAVRPCRDATGPVPNEVTVVVTSDASLDAALLERVSTPSSACGLCGRDEIDAIVARARRIDRTVVVPAGVVASLSDAMREQQHVFSRTGGLHAAGLATGDGPLLCVREDVGRHNAVDKVVGHATLNRLVADVLVVSGRAGFEIVQKAAMAGIPVVAAVSAPTSLAVDVARECGLTLAAFVRGGRMTVYSGAERIS